MAVKYKKGAVRRYPKRNTLGKLYRVIDAMIARGEDHLEAMIGATGKVKVIK